MEHLKEEVEEVDDESQDMENMARKDDTSENSRLVDQPGTHKVNILNLLSNAGSLLFTTYIFYLCFYTSGVSLFSFHPTCMAVGWTLIMGMAINSISPGDVATSWMPIRNRYTRHWVLQATALVFITIGFVSIVVNKYINGKYHFTTLHACFGLTSYILAVVTAFGGMSGKLTNWFKDANLLSMATFKMIHCTGGLVTFGFGMVSIILAMFSHWWSGNDVIRGACIGLLLLVGVLTMLRPSVKLYARIRERVTYIRSAKN